jgi:3',5'-nucleoside bisphosphate phosphatase
MSRGRRPLLAELHAHTTWSDGVLTPTELVDLYGRTGFDVLAITDHVVHASKGAHVRSENYDAYLEELDAEAERARHRFGLLVIPGLELTFDDADPRQAGHAVAVGLRSFVSVEAGLDTALQDARSAGAALIAAHPYPLADATASSRGTSRFAEEPDWAAQAVDRFELFNRDERFDWIGRCRLPSVATGDFHRPEHLLTRKTVLTCEHTEQAVIAALRTRVRWPMPRIEELPVAA